VGAAADRGRDPLTAPLALGSPGLAEEREVTRLAPGVTLHQIVRGRVDPDDFFTVTAGFATTEQEAAALEAKIREAGLEPRRDASVESSPLGGPLGWAVRTGQYRTKAEADAVLPRLRAVGLNPRVDDTAHDGGQTDGPWRVTMVVVDPERFDGSIRSELATEDVHGRENTSSMAARYDAIAAINGGYFTIDGTRDTPGPWLEGTDGDLGGIAVRDGDVVSESVAERPALVLRGDSGKADVRRLATELTITPRGGKPHQVTGLNRTPGLVTNCGGVGRVFPVSGAQHDYTCGNDHELVVFGSEFGAPLPEGDGFQVTLDATGRVTAVGQTRGGPEPAGRQRVVQATGDEADWLEANAEPGRRLTLSEKVVDTDTGQRLPLTPTTSVVNGGPDLVDDGRVALEPIRDGWSPAPIAGANRADFYWRWYVRRNPRTAAGVLPDGRLVFVQVDGRQPGRSVGLSITETARLLDALGAVEAINLDGGGSSAVATRNGLVNTPSDPVERPVADAIVLTP
jgi:phosphodiester glycosidase/sporulation related protein